jgi:4-hydroxyproline epimerase
MIEEGLVTPRVPGELRLEVPAGLVTVKYKMEGKKVVSVKITNVASYLAASDLVFLCPDLGTLKADVAYGGNFYAIIDPQENFGGMDSLSADQIISYSRAIRKNLNDNYSFIHPEDPTINGLSHILWSGKPLSGDSTARNAVFYGESAIDRSPCGTGTSARMAQWVSMGKLSEGDLFINESIIGSKFTGKVEDITNVGSFKAIVPSIEGWAFVTGYNTIIVDEDDPYATGFTIR